MGNAVVEPRAWLAAVALAVAGSAAAQSTDAPRAPRIIDTPERTPAPIVRADAPPTEPVPVLVPSLVQRRPPNAARLAPLPQERSDEPEEIIVIGQGWRLPDLGSDWRARQEETAGAGRFTATALPLYDPAGPPIHTEAFTAPEQRRHGYIELFRLRFGRRARD